MKWLVVNRYGEVPGGGRKRTRSRQLFLLEDLPVSHQEFVIPNIASIAPCRCSWRGGVLVAKMAVVGVATGTERKTRVAVAATKLG